MKYFKILSLILALCLITGCNNSSKKLDDDNIKVTQEKDTANESETSKEEKLNLEPENKKEENTPNKANNNSSNKNPTSNNNTPLYSQNNVATYSNTDELAIQTFEEIDHNVDTILQKKESESLQNKAKGIFITLVDFIFYDGTINGVKFDELTDNGKKKVLEITAKIDEKIENKFPGYKETITVNTKNAFQKASELIKKGANNINEFAKEKLGDNNYQAIIASKDEFVKYTKNAISIIGNVGSNLLNKGKDALNNWYQDFKNGK